MKLDERAALEAAWEARGIEPDIPDSPWRVGAALHDEFEAGWAAHVRYLAASEPTEPMEVDGCTCNEPTCPRHRGFVRDGKGAWRRARPVVGPSFDQAWKLAVECDLVDEYADDLDAEEAKLKRFLSAALAARSGSEAPDGR